MRALVYIRLPEGSVDERGFAMLKLIRASRPAAKRIAWHSSRTIVREQYLLVRLDEDRAINALPTLLGRRCDGTQGSARYSASGSRCPWRYVGRRQAPADAGRDNVRCHAGTYHQGRGCPCLI